MAEAIDSTELLLTYEDLSVRWNRSLNALYAAASRGYLPEPDYQFGNKPIWTEATIRNAERERPSLSKRGKKA